MGRKSVPSCTPLYFWASALGRSAHVGSPKMTHSPFAGKWRPEAAVSRLLM